RRMQTLEAIYSTRTVVEKMISIDQKKLENHYKPGLTFHECVFAEILPKILHADTILVGATRSAIKSALLIIWNIIPFYKYLYKKYDLFPPSNVRDPNSICT
ncbi:hypothetical protein Tsp_03262, partial [Trichinella spiralis]|uniref:hypothetical protein n=1 Tax=Trichinella spiralis TaxID=6334 RepID=UPI0001EFC3B1